MSGWRGRRVTEPQPVFKGHRGEETKIANHGMSGIESLWDNMGRAKTSLRHAENRLAEAERPTSTGNAVDSMSRTSEGQHNIVIDRVPSYRLHDQTDLFKSSGLVDNHGRSQYLKAQGTRKISRLEDKFRDDVPDLASSRHQRSPLREPNFDYKPTKDERHDSRLTGFGSSAYSDVLHSAAAYRPFTTDPFGLHSSANSSSHTKTSATFNQTDPRAIRETELKFLNDESYGHSRPAYLGQGSRLTHVGVTVPGRKIDTPQGPIVSFADPLGTHRAHSIQAGLTNGESAHHDLSSDAGSGNNSTFTVTTNAARTRKLRKGLKHLDPDSEGLAKLKEKIRIQRLNSPNCDGKGSSLNIPQSGGNSSLEEIAVPSSHKKYHMDEEPVQPVTYKEYERETSAPRVRKVAAGPAVPTYKGFAQVETKYRTHDGRVVKLSDGKKIKKVKERKIVCMDSPKEEQKADPARESKTPQKVARVVAPANKPSKYTHHDMITTRSWRVGQKAILRELGPNKLPKTSNSPPTHDKAETEDRSGMEDEEMTFEEHKHSNLEEGHDALAKSKALSEEAKAVLDDMHSDKSDDEDDFHLSDQDDDMESKKKTGKRKRPKVMVDEDQQEKALKVRHYDSDEVRRYIARQRLERKKRQQEEQERQRIDKEKKRLQLEELRKKQKETAKVPPQVPLPQNRPKDAGSSKKYGVGDVDILQKKLSSKPSAESDKENHLSGASSPRSMTSSDSGSTSAHSTGSNTRHSQDKLVEDSAKPSAGQTDDVERIVEKYSRPLPPGPGTKDSGIGTDENMIQKYLSQSGVSVDDLVNRYASQAQDIGSAFNRTGASGAEGEELTGYSSLPPAVSHDHHIRVGRPFTASAATTPGPRSRMDRIQAIRDTAKSLQNRLHQESQRIVNIGASGPDRWAYPRPQGNDLDTDYLGRYDRMAGKEDDFTVFSSDLPGVGNLSEQAKFVTDRKDQDSAATKIQAVYRGHTVRQGMGWTLPSGKTLGSSLGIGHATSKPGASKVDSDESLLSDSTITEDSFDHYYPASNKMGSGLKSVDFHVENKADLGIKPTHKWDQPKGDPYSVMNIMSRKYKGSVTFRQPIEHVQEQQISKENIVGAASGENDDDSLSLSTSESSSLKDRPSGEYEDDFTQSRRSVSHRSRTAGSVGDSSVTSVTRTSHPSRSSNRDISMEKIDDINTESQISSHKTASKSQPKSRSRKDDRYKSSKKSGTESDDDTLDGTLTPSGASDIELDKVGDGDATPTAAKENSLVLSSRHKSRSIEQESLDSDLSSLDQGESRQDPLKEYTRNAARYTGRVSPGGLERRMTAELNLLEGMDESMRQLTDVERTRAISLAQQETVSLAQILKARQQSHQQDMMSLQVRAQQEALDASRQLEDSRRRAAEAAQNAAQAIAQVRAESTTSVQETAQKLLATQAEAARATAEAARQLAEAKIAAANQNSLPAYDPHRVAMETASAAAAAAVSSALQHRPWQQFPYQRHEDRGTQFSLRSSGSRSPLGSRSDPSRTDVSQSFSSETFDSSYTRSPVPSSKPTPRRPTATTSGSISSGSSVPTASDLSKGRPGSAGSIPTASIATDSNLAPRRSPTSQRTASSIRTESGASSPGSKTQSVAEDLPSMSMSERADDYTIEFDTSVVEDLEQSIREVLPAASQRKKMKKEGSQSDLTSSDDLSLSGHPDFSVSSSRRLSFDEESFTRFNLDMVKQYMREEEIRSQHKASLLKLREKALKEKMQAELAWLEQQKKQLRDKGADDVYPQIKKKQRGILIKLKQEQAEIKRLQEAHKAASKERQFILEQSKEVARIKQSTRHVLRQLPSKHWHVEQWLSSLDPSEVTSIQVKERLKRKGVGSGQPVSESAPEDELSLHLDDVSESTVTETPRRDKSDTEYYAEEDKDKRPPSPSDTKAMQKLKKMKLDEKYLTVREQKLRQRRHAAEDLLAWTRKLEEEEEDVVRLEQEVLAKYDRVRGRERQKQPEEKKGKKGAEVRTPRTPRTARTDITVASIVTESVSSATSPSSPQNLDITKSSIQEEVTSTKKSGVSESSIPEDVLDGKTSQSQATSVPEEVPSQTTSIAEEVPSSDKKTPDSSDENTVVNSSVNESYTNETFESQTAETTAATTTHTQTQTATQTTSTRHAGGPGSPRQGRLSKLGLQGAPMSPKSPFASPGRRGSESESEDSFSVSHSAETASDVSDVEGRIRALSDELKRRKLEAERLKREQKRKNKDRLRAQEASLKKQIEAYDSYIIQVKTELQEAESEHHKTAVPPKIKQPAESKRLKKTPEPMSPPTPPEPKLQSESESSKSSSSFEESKDVTVDSSYTPLSGSAQASPIAASADDTQRHQETPSPHRSQAYSDGQRSSLEEDSEIQESEKLHSSKKTSTPEQDSSRRSRSPDHSISKQDSDILEDIPEEASLQSVTVTNEPSELKLNLEDLNDTTVQERDEDFKASSRSDITRKADSPRTESAIPEESILTGRSETSAHYSEDFISRKESITEPSPRTKTSEPPALISARSESAHSVKSEMSQDFATEQSSKHSLILHVDDKSEQVVKGKSEILNHDDKSEDGNVSHRSQESERTSIISQHSDKSDKSYSYSTSSRSTKSGPTYSEGSSRTSRSYTSSRSKSGITSSVSHKSQEPEAKPLGVSENAIETTHTDDDISEQVLVESDDEDQLPELTFDLQSGSKTELPAKPEVKDVKEESYIDKTEASIIEDPIPNINIGDKVIVGGTQVGVLRFKGTTKFEFGFWGGVELDRPEGSCNGSRDGVQYFSCEALHGVFVLPENIKLHKEPESIIDEELPSDVSEHTITDDKPSKSVTLSTKGKDLVSPRKDEPYSASAGREKKDEDDDSITEDISTASELERAISSAAAAVEGFDEEHVESTSPADSLDWSTPAGHVPEKKDEKEEIVDKITDGLTSLIVKDTVEVIGNIQSEREILAQTDLQIGDELQDKVPFLDLDDNKDNEADIVVEPKRKETRQEGKQDKAAEVAVQNLLNEAISQMLTIRQRQRIRSEKVDGDSTESSPAQSPQHSPLSAPTETPFTPEEEILPVKDKSDIDLESDLLSDDIFKTRIQLETHDDFPEPRPVSPLGLSEKPKPGQDDLDQLYDELGALTGVGDEDEWFDDDFGLGSTRKAPPPYPEKDQPLGVNSRSDLKLNLQKVAEEPFYAIPYKPEEVRLLIGDVIDVFWEWRRYGESWDDVEPPSSLFALEDKGPDMESNSRRVYKTLVFQLTGEILRDMYQEEDEEVEQPSWSKPKRLQNKYHQNRQPPTTSDALKPIVQDQVLNLLFSTGRQQSSRLTSRWAGRKKKDHVDMILVQELREEEPSWVDYDDDELTVKMQLADAIFDSLVTETAKVMQDAIAKKV